jgi:hypothetical protein
MRSEVPSAAKMTWRAPWKAHRPIWCKNRSHTSASFSHVWFQISVDIFFQVSTRLSLHHLNHVMGAADMLLSFRLHLRNMWPVCVCIFWLGPHTGMLYLSIVPVGRKAFWIAVSCRLVVSFEFHIFSRASIYYAICINKNKLCLLLHSDLISLFLHHTMIYMGPQFCQIYLKCRSRSKLVLFLFCAYQKIQRDNPGRKYIFMSIILKVWKLKSGTWHHQEKVYATR